MSPDSEAVLSAFINVANDAPDPVVFILDDYHLIEDPSIHTALTFLLDHLPPTLHFVLVGRGEPPLPLARYRARDEMLELGAEDLHFWPEETKDFLNEIMRLDLDHNEVVRLDAQLEGWIAGLQLVALTLQRRLTGANKLVISGRHRFISDYLNEDVLAPLPDNLRHFLLQTSILDRLCGPLCEAVTVRQDGQEMLETVERDNLFLVPLDDRREWFRYHRLFADFLHEELNRRHPDEVTDLHRRASRWYLEYDLSEQAFRHAVDGDDVDLVNQIFERYWPVKVLGGEIRVVERWLDSLPTAWQLGYPGIGFARAGTLLVTGQFEACTRYLDEVKQWLTPAESANMRVQQARLTALRCFIACFQNDLARAETLADRALRGLPEEDHLRPGVYGALGDTYRRNGRWQEAQECYLQALDFDHAPTFQILAAHIFGALADLDLRQGHLRNAASYWREALAAIQKRENWGRLLPLPVTGWMYIRLGELLYEWNELAEAWHHLQRGLEYAELGGDVRAMIAGYLIAGRLKLTAGNIEGAVEYLERTRPHVESAQFSDWLSHFERFQLELWLAQDRLRAAAIWVDEMLQDDVLEGRPESEVAQLAIARVLIVKGDAASIERALARLERLLQVADEEGRTGVQIEGLALQALAHWRRGERVVAMTSLERALRLAEPEGYVRLFADYGLPMARLLHEVRSRAVMPEYVEKLLAACGADRTLLTSAEQALPEPLTPREQEILELLAAGLTNREIGEELVISPETVKKHTGSIYGKLAVRSRREAVARARTLGLLGS
jgi:LuxR family maltose regulon positive regulatory protein